MWKLRRNQRPNPSCTAKFDHREALFRESSVDALAKLRSAMPYVNAGMKRRLCASFCCRYPFGQPCKETCAAYNMFSVDKCNTCYGILRGKSGNAVSYRYHVLHCSPDVAFCKVGICPDIIWYHVHRTPSERLASAWRDGPTVASVLFPSISKRAKETTSGVVRTVKNKRGWETL